MTAKNNSNTPKTPVRDALYTRVSTEDQEKDGTSLEAQMAALRQLSAALGGVVVGEYVDPAESGRKDTRKQYRRMMQDTDKWDRILVFKLDRLHRNTPNSDKLLELVRQGKRVHSLSSGPVDLSNANGKLNTKIQFLFAEHEADQASDRVKLVQAHRMRNKPGTLLGRPGYGYRSVRGRRVIDKPKARIVRRIFSWALKGKSTLKIARNLNKLRIATPSQSQKWSKSIVRQILSSRRYLGEMRWGDHIRYDDHPSLVAKKDFDQVQRMLARQAKLCRPDLYPPKSTASSTPWISKRQQARQERQAVRPRLTYGYVINTEGGFDVYPPEAVAVRMMFDRALAGDGIEIIARKLTAAGYKPRLGNPTWHPTSVFQMLHNRTYTGETNHNGKRFLRTHQPIVSYEEWDHVQLLLRVRTLNHSKSRLDLSKRWEKARGIWKPSDPQPEQPKPKRAKAKPGTKPISGRKSRAQRRKRSRKRKGTRNR